VAHWKEWEAKADEIFGWRSPAGEVRASRRASLFCELGRLTRDSVVLEVGAGTGEFTSRIAPLVKQLHAIDLSPDMLRHAGHRLRDLGMDSTVKLQLQDVTEMTIADATFDAAFGCSVLHHLDAGRALQEIFRVLKPGGWCVFSEPNMMNPQIALQKNFKPLKRMVGDTEDETAFFAWQIRRWLTTAGFTDLIIRHFDFLHPATPSALIPLVESIGRLAEACPGLRTISGSLVFAGRKGK
jgi:ubiquinone/menaquinone biosynthesis C-methylase UbiE